MVVVRQAGCEIGAVRREEYLVDGEGEDRSYPERKGKTWVVSAVLDRVDRLARHVEPIRQVRLAPPVDRPQLAKSGVHKARRLRSSEVMTHAAIPKPVVICS